MEPKPSFRISATSKLQTTEECNVTFQLPAVLSDRLDALVKSLEQEVREPDGSTSHQRTTSRKELVAALILNAIPERLTTLLEAYRDAEAGGAVIPPKRRGYVTVEARSPGMRLTSDQESMRRHGQPVARRNRYSELKGGSA